MAAESFALGAQREDAGWDTDGTQTMVHKVCEWLKRLARACGVLLRFAQRNNQTLELGWQVNPRR